MKLTAKGALKTRQDSRRLSGFGSMWKSGDTGVVYYPIVLGEDGTPDILVSACWGHNINPKEVGLKRIFVPTLSEIVDGVPKVPDITYQFSKIAPLFISGAKEKKMSELEKKNMSESQRKAAMKKTEEEFEKLEPVVGKLRLVISTECVYVPITPDGTPDVEKARLVSQDLSDSRINALLAIIANKQYEVMPGDKWVEVTYAFGTKGDRKEDGKVSPTGVTVDYRLSSKYPELFPRIEQQLKLLPETNDTIEKRNSSFHPAEERDILSALATYSVMESDALDSLTDEESLERLKKNAGVIRTLQIPLQNVELTVSISEDASVRDGVPTMNNLIDNKDIETARESAETEEDLETKTDQQLGGLGLGNLGDLT